MADRDRERDWSRRGDDRGFFDRAGDEVRSWFGDEEAQYRRERDEREMRRGDERGRWPDRRGDEERRWGGHDDSERGWARQWGYVEDRPSRDPERSWSSGWGYSGGYGAGAGYRGGRRDWGGDESGIYWPERGRGGQSWPRAGDGGERSGYASERYGTGWRSGVWQGPHVGQGPRGYRRSDERIKEDVCERMCMDGELDASGIDVVVSGGEVTLQGSVGDRRSKRLAEDLAEQVSGVREVHNQLRITAAGQDQTGQPPWSEGPRHRAA
jgi:osmotically-inducible protein OsmY